MKKILYFLFCLLPLFAFYSCDDKDDIVFEHEVPQFEIKSDAILVEVIVPLETSTSEEIYIVGDFNGGNAAAGNPEWKLVKSKVNLRWGVYLDPTKFVEGKSLSDGYHFVSLTQGSEIALKGDAVNRTATATIGTRLEGKIVRWESYFVSSDDFPIVPANKIMLKINVPADLTPEKSDIALYGGVNGWDGSNEIWHATMRTPSKYYMLLDPNDFAAESSLENEFKLAAIKKGKDWWYHQANLDGGSDDGPGLSIPNAALGNGYEIDIVNWRNVEELNTPDVEEPETSRIKVKQTNGSWSKIVVYAWGDSEYYGGWPGVELEAEEDGWYSFEIPEDQNLNLILNNGNGGEGNQFDFLAGYLTPACYEIDTEAGSWVDADCPMKGITIRWKEKNPTWGGMALYAWGGSPVGDVFGGWPGKVVTADADGWYSVTLEPGQDSGNLIFNNNNGGAQIEPGPSGLTESACFIIDTENLSWETADCP